MRINKFLAQKLGLSRRKVDSFIQDKKIIKNNSVINLGENIEVGDQIEIPSLNQKITVHKLEEKEPTTILLYKPRKTICSRNDEKERKTIYDDLSPKYNDLKYAGRLDYYSEGLLVLTNDGNLIDELTHPKHEHKKVYLVGLNKKLSLEQTKKLEKGIVVDDYQTQPIQIRKLESRSKFSYLHLESQFAWYFFELKEGRNNQIRKMCEAIDTRVLRLIRIQHGDYRLDKFLAKNKIVEVK